MKIPRGVRIVGAAAVLAIAAPASGDVLTELDGLDAREVVSDQELDGMRGGYVTNDSLEVLFGIQQAVYVGDILQSVTPQLVFSATGEAVSSSSLERFQALTGSGTGIIQPGSSTIILPPNIIQNTLNGISIDAVTVINAAVMNLSVVHSMNISSMLTGQLIQSLR